MPAFIAGLFREGQARGRLQPGPGKSTLTAQEMAAYRATGMGCSTSLVEIVLSEMPVYLTANLILEDVRRA